MNLIAHGFFELVMFRVNWAVSSRYLRKPKHYGIRNKFQSSRQTTETNYCYNMHIKYSQSKMSFVWLLS
jgi:hypothetical protein